MPLGALAPGFRAKQLIVCLASASAAGVIIFQACLKAK